MKGIVINIDPTILHLGNFELRWYSLAILLAVIAAVWLVAREGKRKGIKPEDIYSMAPWVIIGGLVGARLFHVFDYWEYYAANPLQILWFQQGGLAILGGLAGGGVVAVACARISHIPMGRLADAAAPALLVAQIIGRFGCIVNGDAYGGVTSLPWGFIYVHPNALIPPELSGVPTHPYPVYEMLWNGAILLFLLRFRRHFPRDGVLFLTYLSLYSLGRFVLTFVRQENPVFWGLQQAQVLALAIIIVSVAVIIYLSRKAKGDMPAEGVRFS